MISWKEKLAWVGMTWEIVSQSPSNIEVLVRGGLCSEGCGTSLEKALEDAARNYRIDWESVSHKITEAAWAKIAHC